MSTPKLKLKNPVTSSQEVGWFHDSKSVKQFKNFAKNQCDETVFASAYYGMKKQSIYSNLIKKPTSTSNP